MTRILPAMANTMKAPSTKPSGMARVRSTSVWFPPELLMKLTGEDAFGIPPSSEEPFFHKFKLSPEQMEQDFMVHPSRRMPCGQTARRRLCSLLRLTPTRQRRQVTGGSDQPQQPEGVGLPPSQVLEGLQDLADSLGLVPPHRCDPLEHLLPAGELFLWLFWLHPFQVLFFSGGSHVGLQCNGSLAVTRVLGGVSAPKLPMSSDLPSGILIGERRGGGMETHSREGRGESRRYQLQGRVTDGDVPLTILVPSGVMQARDPRQHGSHIP
ncbi:hypothetical protein EYF80_027512 [Liparis tanakae]|uniref:Uncharacterized protein n=1 Tax=Liparis tanakae TaxID=230148 RepID=A0A4Z2H8N1_9TELE|nr:hypothetical protein EYF80_027512 [Liparis tanakae]